MLPIPPRRKLLPAAGGSCLLAAAGRSAAQAFPSSPITLIMPIQSGCPTDRHFLLLADLSR